MHFLTRFETEYPYPPFLNVNWSQMILLAHTLPETQSRAPLTKPAPARVRKRCGSREFGKFA